MARWHCPVCGAEVVVDYRDTLDEGTVCESAEHCPNGCWEAEFHYGHDTERIGHQEWHWSWTETKEGYETRRQGRLRAIEEARDVLNRR